MTTIQWRPAINALTVPQSYKILFVPRNSAGWDDLAADIAADYPYCDQELVSTLIRALPKKIQARLINGEQVTLEDAFSCSLSFLGKLDAADDPLPNRDDLLQVKMHALASFVREVRQEAHLERMALSQKMPLIASAEDTRLKLNDVLYAKGVLKLTGANLLFDEEDPECSCVIEGTRSGRTVQSQFAMISNTEILVVPDIPAQESPWNNEYTVSVSTQYTEHGKLRTGTYQGRLRSPLLVDDLDIEGGIGILTGTANLPCAAVTGGAVSADETLRISAIFDIHAGHLLLNLIDMKEGGKAGAAVTVTANGVYTLNGFADSAVTNLEITVSSYAELVTLVRDGYSCRLADILELRSS